MSVEGQHKCLSVEAVVASIEAGVDIEEEAAIGEVDVAAVSEVEDVVVLEAVDVVVVAAVLAVEVLIEDMTKDHQRALLW